MHKPSGSVSSHVQTQQPPLSISGNVSADLSKNLTHPNKKPLHSEAAASSVPVDLPISSSAPIPVLQPTNVVSSESPIAQEIAPIETPSPKKPGFFGKVKNFFTKPFTKLSGSSKNSSTPSLRQRTKSKVGSIFSSKKDTTLSTGTETMAVGNKNFEIRHGKWYNKILANTVGRISSVLMHSVLTLRPWQGLQNPDVAKVKDILSRYSNVDRDADHTIYLGHTDRWDQIKKMFARRKGFGNTIQNISFIPMVILQSIFSNIRRSDHYNPLTKSITLHSPHEWIAAHELGHAEDFAQKWDFREYEKRFWPIYGTLLIEKNASTNAISRARTEEEKRKAEKVLYPAFGSYVGAMILSPFVYTARKLGLFGSNGSKFFDTLAGTLGRVVGIPALLGIGLGHINARLPKRWRWKIFDKPNNQTSGDTDGNTKQEITQQPVQTVPLDSSTEQTVVEDVSGTTALTQQLTEQNKNIETMKEELKNIQRTTGEALSQKDKEIKALKEQLDKNPATEVVDKNSPEKKSTGTMEKQALRIKDQIQTLLPANYTTRIDTSGGFQRIVISDPTKEEKIKPELYLTLSKEGEKTKLHYSPYDHYDEFYYHGELDSTKEVDLAKVISLITESMQGKISDAVQFEKDLDMYGIQKKFAQKQKEPDDVADKKSSKNKNKKKGVVA